MNHTFPVCSDEAQLYLKVPVDRGRIQRVNESVHPLFSRDVAPGLFRSFAHGPLGNFDLVYLTSQPTACAENHVVIKVRHCAQSVILLLCVPHHLAGVAFRASSIANNLCCVGTFSSKSDRKASKGFIPSKVGKLLTVVPIQRTSLVNLAHLLVDTSYIWFCQFSSASSESDEHMIVTSPAQIPIGCRVDVILLSGCQFVYVF
jgi:hypothetical protein